MVTSSITVFEAGPSRLFTASCTVFWDFTRSCICDVSRNCRPQASRNLQEAKYAFITFVKNFICVRIYFETNTFFTCLPWRACGLVVCSWT